jgi:hypothetical protein
LKVVSLTLRELLREGGDKILTDAIALELTARHLYEQFARTKTYSVFLDAEWEDLWQRVYLDVDDLFEESTHHYPPDRATAAAVAIEVLSAIDRVERSVESSGIDVSHPEDIGAWRLAIADYLARMGGECTFEELLSGLGLELVEVWMGVLLGGFIISSRVDSFYNGNFQIASGN